MSKKEKFLESIAKGYIVLGEFKNEHGEEYIVYKEKDNELYVMISGDELDWEDGWIYFPEDNSLKREFFFGDDETQEILKIFKKLEKK